MKFQIVSSILTSYLKTLLKIILLFSFGNIVSVLNMMSIKENNSIPSTVDS